MIILEEYTPFIDFLFSMLSRPDSFNRLRRSHITQYRYSY